MSNKELPSTCLFENVNFGTILGNNFFGAGLEFILNGAHKRETNMLFRDGVRNRRSRTGRSIIWHHPIGHREGIARIGRRFCGLWIWSGRRSDWIYGRIDIAKILIGKMRRIRRIGIARCCGVSYRLCDKILSKVSQTGDEQLYCTCTGG